VGDGPRLHWGVAEVLPKCCCAVATDCRFLTNAASIG
jgi:hypothetical protein